MIYDVGIIGTGLAGSFAALKLSKEKDIKIAAFELGRPPQKRRRQIEGWFGCLPNSDGKLYLSDADKVSQIIGARKANSSLKAVQNYLSNIDTFKTIKDKGPQVSLEKKIKKAGYSVTLNDYMQMFPKEIHLLSKHMSDEIEQQGNVTFYFDTEITQITKSRGVFTVSAGSQEYKCKKLILAVGRSGWRFAADIFKNFGIIENNDYSKFGIRVEMNSGNMTAFNKSSCTLLKEDIEIGPLCWNGTVIPEDHLEGLAITAFRSNENRWKTDKVSFTIIGNRYFKDGGFEQTDRIGKLTYLLSNDRILKEKVSTILSNKSKISVLAKDYGWLVEAVNDLKSIMPDIDTKAYFHVPTIIPSAPPINIGPNLETEIPGLFVIGETSGISGLLAASIMGVSVASEICKE